jgi:hypothetical protein
VEQAVKALSLTQPYAWIVVHGGKRIENRAWNTAHRGDFLIHASSTMSKKQYWSAWDAALVADPELHLPASNQLQLGGIVGVASLTDVLAATPTPTVRWHLPDQCGFVLEHVRALPFTRCKGALNFWEADFELSESGALLFAPEPA